MSEPRDITPPAGPSCEALRGQDPLLAPGTWCSRKLSLDCGTWPITLGKEEPSWWPRLACGRAPSAAPLCSTHDVMCRAPQRVRPASQPAPSLVLGEGEAAHDGVKSCGNRASRGVGLEKDLWCFCCGCSRLGEGGLSRKAERVKQGGQGPAHSHGRVKSSVLEPLGLSCANPHRPDPSLAQSRCLRKGTRGGGGRGFPPGVSQPAGAPGPLLLPPAEARAMRVRTRHGNKPTAPAGWRGAQCPAGELCPGVVGETPGRGPAPATLQSPRQRGAGCAQAPCVSQPPQHPQPRTVGIVPGIAHRAPAWGTPATGKRLPLGIAPEQRDGECAQSGRRHGMVPATILVLLSRAVAHGLPGSAARPARAPAGAMRGMSMRTGGRPPGPAEAHPRRQRSRQHW